MKLEKRTFGQIGDQVVDLYVLRNTPGVEMKVTNYGGIIVSLETPDREGEREDIVLGFNQLEAYQKDSPYFGAIIGRYGNRIAGGRFTLGGKEYTLACNEGDNNLHGGNRGFDKVVWEAAPLIEQDRVGIKLKYLSRDGEEGFPGNLDVMVIYSLTDDNELQIEYRAATDKITVVNLTNHSYFNLAGEGYGDILDQEVMINADHFTPVNENLIPTGELAQVTDTPMDFRVPTAIGARIDADYRQLELGEGYDHNYVLNQKQAGEMTQAATAYDPESGRFMEVLTTEPGMQFYSGNFLDGPIGKSGEAYLRRCGFCFETQHYPDSPNQPDFPSVVLKPGEEYSSRTTYRFSVR